MLNNAWADGEMTPEQYNLGNIDDETKKKIFQKLDSTKKQVNKFGLKLKKGEMAAILLEASPTWKAIEIWFKDNRFGLFGRNIRENWEQLNKEAKARILKEVAKENFNAIFKELWDEAWKVVEPKIEEALHDGDFIANANRILQKHHLMEAEG